ncbi:Mg chelatase-like protein [Segniliparus rugosus ATCC BAA-974]|uniref:Mg chelatase-like protein n=1 Tax=Segniliparus rugosus (strain ATCC BAA-974 / DSM 45345 / CCUG 50838 / CIP 108380 / JCM 13579 / CDC 945) TaxID=679197 RepID=U1M2J0_SEGRC|nr:Mg chelatase-like protein [Segniliparus rugosus ATCC BAA-974]
MMPMGRSHSVGVIGVDGLVIEVEAYLGSGASGVCLVGLPDAALQESRDRIRAAVHNSGAAWPQGRVTLALSPATIRKVGSMHDAALAVAVLVASGSLPAASAKRAVILGELALDGRLRPVRGVLPAMLAARKAGWTDVVVPEANLPEAGLVTGLRAHGAASLRSLCAWLRGERELPGPEERPPVPSDPCPDLADVVGHEEARFALEVAAAGAHHLMLTGPPGVGKTLLAARLVGLLPELTEEESLEVTAIHSLAGSLSETQPVVLRPPFIAPHHTTSVSALVGGGVGMATPGAVSKAHCGVLFLDECAEMGAKALESLRTPLEEGEVRIARRDGVASYPARFQLVLACNPCPCAPSRERDCVCPLNCGGAISAGFPARSWTGWTCGSGCTRCPRGCSRESGPSRPRRSDPESSRPVPPRGNAGGSTAGAPTPKCPAPRCGKSSRWRKPRCSRWSSRCAEAWSAREGRTGACGSPGR